MDDFKKSWWGHRSLPDRLELEGDWRHGGITDVQFVEGSPKHLLLWGTKSMARGVTACHTGAAWDPVCPTVEFEFYYLVGNHSRIMLKFVYWKDLCCSASFCNSFIYLSTAFSPNDCFRSDGMLVWGIHEKKKKRYDFGSYRKSLFCGFCSFFSFCFLHLNLSQI